MITECQLMECAQQLEREYATEIADIRAVQRRNFMRILDAFHTVGLSTSDLRPMSGYGSGTTCGTRPNTSLPSCTAHKLHWYARRSYLAPMLWLSRCLGCFVPGICCVA